MSYTDLTSSFAYKDLLSFAKMDALAANDAYDVFLSGTKTVFYQSSLPAGWTKATGFNDSALRVVAGASGGTAAGSSGLSSTVTLAHTHTGTAHTHTGFDHAHDMSTTPVLNMDFSFSDARSVENRSTLRIVNTTAIGSTARNYAGAGTDTSGSLFNTSSNSAGVTNSQLANIQFAYCDVLIASKDA